MVPKKLKTAKAKARNYEIEQNWLKLFATATDPLSTKS
jgi:hypothetical protein